MSVRALRVAVIVVPVALIIGVAVGTYSSIFVASPTALALDVSATDLMPPQKEESEVDALP